MRVAVSMRGRTPQLTWLEDEGFAQLDIPRVTCRSDAVASRGGRADQRANDESCLRADPVVGAEREGCLNRCHPAGLFWGDREGRRGCRRTLAWRADGGRRGSEEGGARLRDAHREAGQLPLALQHECELFPSVGAYSPRPVICRQQSGEPLLLLQSSATLVEQHHCPRFLSLK